MTEADDRIEAIKKRARDIISGKATSEEDIEIVLRFFLAKTYHIPIFSEYFDNRTFEELIFEVELWRAYMEVSDPSTRLRQASEITKEFAKSKEDVDEFLKGIEDSWEDVDPEKIAKEDADFLNRVGKDFMQRGKFKGEEDGPTE